MLLIVKLDQAADADVLQIQTVGRSASSLRNHIGRDTSRDGRRDIQIFDGKKTAEGGEKVVDASTGVLLEPV